jgi:hypothetical protein
MRSFKNSTMTRNPSGMVSEMKMSRTLPESRFSPTRAQNASSSGELGSIEARAGSECAYRRAYLGSRKGWQWP